MLYRNIEHWDWSVATGELVAFIRYPFWEWHLDPIFKVNRVDTLNYVMDIEVVQSSFLEIGTIYLNQTIDSFRRIKMTNINPDFTYKK